MLCRIFEHSVCNLLKLHTVNILVCACISCLSVFFSLPEIKCCYVILCYVTVMIAKPMNVKLPRRAHYIYKTLYIYYYVLFNNKNVFFLFPEYNYTLGKFDKTHLQTASAN